MNRLKPLSFEYGIKISSVATFLLSSFLIFKSQEVSFWEQGWVSSVVSLMLYFFWNEFLFDKLWNGGKRLAYSSFMQIGLLLAFSWLFLHIYFLSLFLAGSPLFV